MGGFSRSIILLVFIANLQLGQLLKCPDFNAFKLPNGDCLYVKKYDRQWTQPVTWAQNECKNLNEHPYEWYLPMAKNTEEHEAMTDIIRSTVENYAKFNDYNLFFWMGLMREQEDISLENTTWADPTKWRWMMDNSSLSDSFPNGQVPPWRAGEPNKYQELDERCVYAHRLADEAIHWFDHKCDENGRWPPFDLLICQSQDKSGGAESTTPSGTARTSPADAAAANATSVSATTINGTIMPDNTSSETTPASASNVTATVALNTTAVYNFTTVTPSSNAQVGKSGGSSSRAIGLGLGLTIVFLAMLVGAAWYIRRRRRLSAGDSILSFARFNDYH